MNALIEGTGLCCVLLELCTYSSLGLHHHAVVLPAMFDCFSLHHRLGGATDVVCIVHLHR